MHLKIDMQANLDKKYLTELGPPKQEDVSPHINSP